MAKDKTNKTPKADKLFIYCNCPPYRHPVGGYTVKVAAKPEAQKTS